MADALRSLAGAASGPASGWRRCLGWSLARHPPGCPPPTNAPGALLRPARLGQLARGPVLRHQRVGAAARQPAAGQAGCGGWPPAAAGGAPSRRVGPAAQGGRRLAAVVQPEHRSSSEPRRQPGGRVGCCSTAGGGSAQHSAAVGSAHGRRLPRACRSLRRSRAHPAALTAFPPALPRRLPCPQVLLAVRSSGGLYCSLELALDGQGLTVHSSLTRQQGQPEAGSRLVHPSHTQEPGPASSAFARLAAYLGGDRQPQVESQQYRRVQPPPQCSLLPAPDEPPGMALLRRCQARRAGGCRPWRWPRGRALCRALEGPGAILRGWSSGAAAAGLSRSAARGLCRLSQPLKPRTVRTTRVFVCGSPPYGGCGFLCCSLPGI